MVDTWLFLLLTHYTSLLRQGNRSSQRLMNLLKVTPADGPAEITTGLPHPRARVPSTPPPASTPGVPSSNALTPQVTWFTQKPWDTQYKFTENKWLKWFSSLSIWKKNKTNQQCLNWRRRLRFIITVPGTWMTQVSHISLWSFLHRFTNSLF